jgi:adenosylcobinamide-phosphate synthase
LPVFRGKVVVDLRLHRRQDFSFLHRYGMTFFSVLLALVIEQIRALDSNNPVAKLLRSHAAGAGRGLDAGRGKHGILAWLGVVLPWTLGVGVVYYLLCRMSFVLAFAWNVVVLYFTLGFRQFSHYFTDIHLALNNDDLPLAREILQQWTGMDTSDMPVSEVVRHTLMYAVISSHRHVFGVFFWFLIPIGPAGAVLYRVAAHLSASWSEPSSERSPAFTDFARKAFFFIDWIPTRLTALGFAIVGNFEDAIYAWRQYARHWPDSNEGTLLAAGSGALGARLVGPLAEPTGAEMLTGAETPAALPVGEDCTPRTLQSAVGLVWRAVILWMILLLMVTVSVWLA